MSAWMQTDYSDCSMQTIYNYLKEIGIKEIYPVKKMGRSVLHTYYANWTTHCFNIWGYPIIHPWFSLQALSFQYSFGTYSCSFQFVLLPFPSGFLSFDHHSKKYSHLPEIELQHRNYRHRHSQSVSVRKYLNNFKGLSWYSIARAIKHNYIFFLGWRVFCINNAAYNKK